MTELLFTRSGGGASTAGPSPVPLGHQRVCLTDIHRHEGNNRIIDIPDIHFVGTLTYEGVCYTHVDELPDGMWRYAPIA